MFNSGLLLRVDVVEVKILGLVAILRTANPRCIQHLH